MGIKHLSISIDREYLEKGMMMLYPTATFRSLNEKGG